MALKDLKLAVELLHAGMPLAEISQIIKMQDVSADEQDPAENQDDPAPEPDSPDDKQDPAEDQDDPAPEPDPAPVKPKPAEKKEPLNRPEPNRQGTGLIDELNKLF